jgi:hypothetical protein
VYRDGAPDSRITPRQKDDYITLKNLSKITKEKYR